MDIGNSQLLQDAFWDSMDQSSANVAAILEAKQSVAAVLAVGATLDATLASIASNEMLSDLAKQKQSADARDKAQRDLALASGSATTKSANRIAATLKLMTPPALNLGVDGRAAFIVGMWEIFGRLNSSQQSEVYLTASIGKNDLVLAAFDQWPDFDPRKTIDANSIQQGKLLRQQAENQDAAAELEALQGLDAQLRSAIGSVEARVGSADAISLAAGSPLVDAGGPRGGAGSYAPQNVTRPSNGAAAQF
jgi:hypothetical protein